MLKPLELWRFLPVEAAMFLSYLTAWMEFMAEMTLMKKCPDKLGLLTARRGL